MTYHADEITIVTDVLTDCVGDLKDLKRQERSRTFNFPQRNGEDFTSSIDAEMLSSLSLAFRISSMNCGPEQQTSHSSRRGTRKMPSGYYKMHRPGI
jgi:hypothetical protein